MAKDTNDNVTNEMFNDLEKTLMMSALQSHIKTLRRQAASETNEQIKPIREAEAKKFANLFNKMQGL